MTKKHTTSEWTGIKGRIGAWMLNSPLRRLETLFLGDYKAAFLNEVSQIIRGNEVVLDVGAGSGYFSLTIAKKLSTGKIICLDLSEKMLQHLERKADKECLKDRIQILKAEASSFELKDESVDLAVCNFVFHELSGPEAVLAEILRVLKPDGWVIITDFRDGLFGKLIGASHRGNAHGAFSADGLEALLAKAGLSSVKVSPVRQYIIGAGKK